MPVAMSDAIGHHLRTRDCATYRTRGRGKGDTGLARRWPADAHSEQHAGVVSQIWTYVAMRGHVVADLFRLVDKTARNWSRQRDRAARQAQPSIDDIDAFGSASLAGIPHADVYALAQHVRAARRDRERAESLARWRSRMLPADWTTVVALAGLDRPMMPAERKALERIRRRCKDAGPSRPLVDGACAAIGMPWDGAMV